MAEVEVVLCLRFAVCAAFSSSPYLLEAILTPIKDLKAKYVQKTDMRREGLLACRRRGEIDHRALTTA